MFLALSQLADLSVVPMELAAAQIRVASRKIPNLQEPTLRFGVCPVSDKCVGGSSMGAEHLRRFAAECEAVAHETRNPREKEVWRGLAERWLRCAALLEQEETDLRARRKKDRQTIH